MGRFTTAIAADHTVLGEVRVMPTVQGYITVVQEGRFRVVADDGRGLLLTLASNARAEPLDLERLEHAHARVTVDYSGEPNLASGTAHSVTVTAATPTA